MAETLSRKDLIDDQKLRRITSYQSRFDKLQRDRGVLTRGPLMPPGPAPQVDKPANNVDDKAVSGRKRKAAPETNADEENELHKDTTENTLTPALKMVYDMHIESMYERKATELTGQNSRQP